MKNKSLYFCSECGFESAKWMGKCPACGSWNTFSEEPVIKASSDSRKKGPGSSNAAVPTPLSGVEVAEEARISSGIGELDRVLGGGIVPGSLILVGGDPGIGKSTLLLQVSRNLANSGRKMLYVSGEESMRQIRMRADRLGGFSEEIFLLSETDLETVRETIIKYHPEAVVIDSIQTMYSDDVSSGAGSVSQVREATNIFMQLAKKEGVAIFIVGHVTKEGVVAGPRVLEHMVDTVLYFEGDRHAQYRILRAVKNRFGSTNEIGVFEMAGSGLSEVLNPSQYMIEGRQEDAPGSVVTCAIEGTRPIMLEVQALVAYSNFQIPRRTAAGTDYNKINIIMAVLEKRLGLKTGSCDAYINLAGGMRLSEPAIDLAIAGAVISSFSGKPVSPSAVLFGEVGLTGEVRAVNQAESRVKEAQKLGFTECLVPEANTRNLKGITGIKIIPVRSLRDLYSYITG
ncbi:MAG: DNA repair protein RadA [Lachnospiraceae bacterium]|nr:DNA repair protein RadA [Lachnospiraceae bacterium]